MRFWSYLLALPALLASCSPAHLVNALASRDSFRLVSDVAYGADPRQTLDLYLPLGEGAKKPVVLFFYGGNWDSGKKEDYLFLGQALAARGVIVAIADYRIYPEVRYPDFLADCAEAAKWTLAHIDSYGGDPARVTIMGHSAGAYNALMLALDAKWLGPARRQIKGVIGLAGPYDFLPLTDPTLKIIFGPGDLSPTQPINYADGTAPPVLLATGRLDQVVSPGNTTRLAARIRAQGGEAETRYYALLGHITLIGSFGVPLRYVTSVIDDVTGFIEAPGIAAHAALVH